MQTIILPRKQASHNTCTYYILYVPDRPAEGCGRREAVGGCLQSPIMYAGNKYQALGQCKWHLFRRARRDERASAHASTYLPQPWCGRCGGWTGWDGGGGGGAGGAGAGGCGSSCSWRGCWAAAVVESWCWASLLLGGQQDCSNNSDLHLCCLHAQTDDRNGSSATGDSRWSFRQRQGR